MFLITTHFRLVFHDTRAVRHVTRGQDWDTCLTRGMVRQKSGETAMASPTPSLDSLNGVLAMCGDSGAEQGHLDMSSMAYSHVFSGAGSSSGVSSATSSSSASSASSLDRASTGSASSTSGNFDYRKKVIFYLLCKNAFFNFGIFSNVINHEILFS